MIPGLPPVLTQAAQGLSNLVLVTPLLSPTYGPIDSDPNNFGNALGPPLIFTTEGENTVNLQSEITDHFIETNSSVDDHVALRPERITVHGFIGELTNTFPAFLPPSTQVQAILGAISQFAPSFSKSAMNVINEAFQAYQAVSAAVNGAVSAWNTITGAETETFIGSQGISVLGANQTKQQLMFSQLYGYWARPLRGLSPALFQVQTPWAIFGFCAIESVNAVQDEKSEELTDFFVTFKVLRFVSTSSTNGPRVAGRLQQQSALLTQNGSASLGGKLSLPSGNFGLGG